MYTIKQAAARTGVSVPTIRAWERRYGVVGPARTTAGYRLYDDDGRLNASRRCAGSSSRSMARPTSQAADEVRDGGGSGERRGIHTGS